MKSDFLSNLFFRALQTVSVATMLVRLLLPVAIAFTLRLPNSWPLVAGHATLWLLLPVLNAGSAVALALFTVARR